MHESRLTRRRSARSAHAALALCLAAVSASACAERPTTHETRAAPHGPAPSTVDSAAALARAGDTEGALAALRVAFDAERDAPQRALLEPAFRAGLRDDQRFRALVEEALLRHRVSHIQLAPDDEPGVWVDIDGRTTGADGAPLGGVAVRAFATDAAGRYHPNLEGESTPRLFGWVVSDDEGSFTVRTVRPGPYPGTRNPPHLHVGARRGELRLAAPGYAVFDDDPLLDEPGNEEQRAEALRIVMRPSPSGAARGWLELPLR